jgi:hypothetical protein
VCEDFYDTLFLEDNLGALELSLSSDRRERIEAPVTPRWPAAAKDI